VLCIFGQFRIANHWREIICLPALLPRWLPRNSQPEEVAYEFERKLVDALQPPEAETLRRASLRELEQILTGPPLLTTCAGSRRFLANATIPSGEWPLHSQEVTVDLGAPK
jgi:hypothetical protein